MRSLNLQRLRRGGLAGLLAGAVLAGLVACGGGGSGSDAAGTNFAQGAITGLGSIIVNGVRYDDRRATVLDDDDRARRSSELLLGVMVEVESDRVRAASASGDLPTATATRIRMGSEIVGPVEGAPAATSFRILGQTINVTDTTVFDDSLAGGITAITDGMVLEVHALFDAATGQYTATRIEDEDSATSYKLRGLVSALDTTLKIFKIGEAVINYAGVDPATLPNNFADGLRVRVRLQTTQVNGEWVATSVRAGVRKVEDHDEAHLRGTITEFTSTASFSVNGLPVDATHARFEDGTEGLVLGARVEVEGSVVNGVLVATKVELEGRHRGDDRHGIELHDRIASIDAEAKTFTLERGTTVSYAGSVNYKDGTQASIAVGRRVEVKGVLAADGVTVNAVKIEFES
jgi:hypothetical protein